VGRAKHDKRTTAPRLISTEMQNHYLSSKVQVADSIRLITGIVPIDLITLPALPKLIHPAGYIHEVAGDEA
jgi:hypothetical protein